jgi:putative membrane protein
MTSTVLVRAHEWRRLDPLMLLVHPVNELVRFLPLVIATVVFGSSGDDRGPWQWQWIGVAIPIALGVGRFLTTRFRITTEQVELRRGLFARSVLRAPLDRVRTVEVTSSPIHRLLGLAKVAIGTGSAARAGDERLELDGLALRHARELRTALLRRAVTADVPGAAGAVTRRPDTGRVLLRFDPRWLRYAPLTSSGIVIAAAVAAGVGQLVDAAGDRLTRWSLPDLAQLALWIAVPLGLVLAVALFSVFAVLGYLITNGGFRLSVDPSGRTFHITRGLVTTRETTLERDRIRGVEVHEPLGLRLGGAARLSAAVTGLDRRTGGTSPLAPPAPYDVVIGVGTEILDGSPALVVPLRHHGPRALRRRYLRAASGLGLPLLVAAAITLQDRSWAWTLLPTTLLLVVAEPLARDRYRRLGHALDARHLVVSSGTFSSRRQVLAREGIIGWNIRQSWFQRRGGLCDLVATTSAGRQACTAHDVPEPVAVALASAAVPGLLGQFRG